MFIGSEWVEIMIDREEFYKRNRERNEQQGKFCCLCGAPSKGAWHKFVSIQDIVCDDCGDILIEASLYAKCRL